MSNSTSTADTTSETQDVEAPQGETPNTSDESSETLDETTTTTQPSIEELLERDKRKEASLKRANKEAKEYRVQLEELKKSQVELQKFKSDVEAEKLSANEKQERAQQQLQQQLADLQKERDDTIRQSQERIVNYEVRLQAARMGIVDPDVAAKLLDWSEIEYDDNGSPSNVESLLNDLLKNKSYLKAPQSRPVATSGGATNPSRSSTANASQALSWESITKMTADQYNARRAEIQRWMNDPQNIRR